MLPVFRGGRRRPAMRLAPGRGEQTDPRNKARCTSGKPLRITLLRFLYDLTGVTFTIWVYLSSRNTESVRKFHSSLPPTGGADWAGASGPHFNLRKPIGAATPRGSGGVSGGADETRHDL